jgi:carboxymethylenebutenolidase
MGNIELTAADGHTFQAYVAGGDDPPAGIVVVQEIFGVNSHVRSVTDRLAGAGYRVIAPAFFDRVESGVELGYGAEGIEAGRGYAVKLNWDDTMADLHAAVDHLAPRPVGVVGFCWGGTAAWLAAARLPVAAAVGYYGGGIHGFVDETPLAPVVLHFGRQDHAIPMDHVEAVRSAHPEVPVHVYDAGHGFNCDVRASFDADAAAQAWSRTLAFFEAELAP